MIRKTCSIALISATTAATALTATAWVGSYALEHKPFPSRISNRPITLPGWQIDHSFSDTRHFAAVGRQGRCRIYVRWEGDDDDMATTSQGIIEWGRAYAGFAFYVLTIGDYELRHAAVPFWFLVIAFSTWPTLAFIRGPFRRRRRRRNGACLACGYNLTGNVSGRCPECGKETPVE